LTQGIKRLSKNLNACHGVTVCLGRLSAEFLGQNWGSSRVKLGLGHLLHVSRHI